MNVYIGLEKVPFLECYGGACTKYKESVINNGWTDGSLLKVLSEEETIDWLMENKWNDVLEELFLVYYKKVKRGLFPYIRNKRRFIKMMENKIIVDNQNVGNRIKELERL